MNKVPLLGYEKQVDELNTTLQKKKTRWAQRKSTGLQKSLLDNNIITVFKKFLLKYFEVPRGTRDS